MARLIMAAVHVMNNDVGEGGNGGFRVRGVGLDGSGSIDSGGGRGGGDISSGRCGGICRDGWLQHR